MVPMEIPRGLRWWRGRPEGARWLSALPAHVAAACERWSLRLGAIFEAPHMIGFVAAVEREDGTRAVLKANPPDRESVHEPDALAFWDGRGAVRLLANDPPTRTFLLERCEPGTPLLQLDALAWAVDDSDDAYDAAHVHVARLLADA